MRALLSSRWLGRHAAMVGLVAATVLLGRWQWSRGMAATGSGRNIVYAVQWWFFALVVVYGWWRLIREELHPTQESADAPGAGAQDWASLVRRPAPVPDQQDEPDPELAAYNERLAWLNAHPRR